MALFGLPHYNAQIKIVEPKIISNLIPVDYLAINGSASYQCADQPHNGSMLFPTLNNLTFFQQPAYSLSSSLIYIFAVEQPNLYIRCRAA
jgi:hypothetical protein